MKKLRKIDTAKRKKERKDARERLAAQATHMLNHPEDCCVCHAPFERTAETVLTWRVRVRDEAVRLTCPDCWGVIKEALAAKE